MPGNRLNISKEPSGVFKDFIPVRARVVPLETVFLDAKGGRAKAHISQSEYNDFVDKLKYNQQIREVTLESQMSDEKLMAAQLAFFNGKTIRMENNLTFVCKNLQDLKTK